MTNSELENMFEKLDKRFERMDKDIDRITNNAFDKKYYMSSDGTYKKVENENFWKERIKKFEQDMEKKKEKMEEKTKKQLEWQQKLMKSREDMYVKIREEQDIINLYIAHIPLVIFSIFGLVGMFVGNFIMGLIFVVVTGLLFYVEYYLYNHDEGIRKRLDRFYSHAKAKYEKIKEKIPKIEFE